MRYWRQARQVRTVVLAGVATVLALLFPFTVLSATPSPGGATVGLSTLVSLGIPVLTGWGVSRGDRVMEQRSVRPVALLDIGLTLAACLGVAVVEVMLRASGASPAGLIAARATVTYAGLMLAAVPLVGSGNASMLPVAYLIAVVIVGGGGDVDHPATWAWIAAREDDAGSAIAALASLAVGTGAYLVHLRSE